MKVQRKTSRESFGQSATELLPSDSQKTTGDTGGTGDSPGNAGVSASPVENRGPGTPGTGFHLKDSWVWFESEEGEPQWICSPLHITAMTRNADGEAWGRLLEFQDEDNRGHRWPCPMELLAGDGTEFRRTLLSLGLRISPGTKARNLLATYVQTAKVEARAVCTDCTGWHGNAMPMYCLITRLVKMMSAYCFK